MTHSDQIDKAANKGKINLIAFLIITRPENVLITAVSVVVGGLISAQLWLTYTAALSLAAISAGLISAGGNTFNDYCDRDLDRNQKAHRPIPSGKISPNAALIWSGLCFAAGLWISIIISPYALLVASWAVVLLLYYSWRWKSRPLIGNLVVAFVAALAFIYGGIAVGSVSGAFWAALLAFLFHCGREVIKDMEDQSGDSVAHADTMVVRYGSRMGKYTATVFFLALILVLPFPYALGNFGQLYLYAVLIGVLPVLVAVLWLLWHWTSPAHLHRISVILKLDMLVGLAALLIGKPAN